MVPLTHSALFRLDTNRPAIFKQNGICVFTYSFTYKTAFKAKMTVASLVESSSTAQIRCYATRISKVFAAPGSHFSAFLHQLGRDWWLLITLFLKCHNWNLPKANMWHTVSAYYSGNIWLYPFLTPLNHPVTGIFSGVVTLSTFILPL